MEARGAIGMDELIWVVKERLCCVEVKPDALLSRFGLHGLHALAAD
jgi:hypothetical protein